MQDSPQSHARKHRDDRSSHLGTKQCLRTRAARADDCERGAGPEHAGEDMQPDQNDEESLRRTPP